MAHTKKNIAAALLAALFVVTAAYAGDSPEDIKQRIGKGDPAAGKEKSAMCQGCHGEIGISDSSTFPKLAGQFANYLQKQIRDFQNELRNDPTMSSMAATVTEKQDLLDITAYFASQKHMKGSGKGNDKGKAIYLEGTVEGVYACVNCHGENGKGKAPHNAMFPVIGGQHKDYLVKQLTDFNKEDRKNDPSGMMGDIAKKMTPAEIEAVADYLSTL